MGDFILAFDPSLNGTGYAVLRNGKSKPKLVDWGTIHGRNKTWGEEDTQQVKLALIAAKTKELVAKYRPAHHQVFLERGYSNQYVNSTQLIFKARGALESELVGFEIVEIPPTSVKKIIADYGLANKDSVAECVAEFLDVPLSTFSTDNESDAAAIAVAGWLKYVRNGQK